MVTWRPGLLAPAVAALDQARQSAPPGGTCASSGWIRRARRRGRRPACPRRTVAAEIEAPICDHLRQVARAPTRASRSRWRRSPEAVRRRGRAAASAACRASDARGVPRTDRRRDSAAPRAGRSRSAPRRARGCTERRCCSSSHSATGVGSFAQARSSASMARTRAARCVESGNLPLL